MDKNGTGSSAQLVPMGIPLSGGTVASAPLQQRMVQIDPNDSRYYLALPGAHPCIQVELKPGDVGVKSVGGTMLTIDPNMSLSAECEGGSCNGCLLALLGETCWFNHYRPKGGASADVLIAPELSGDIGVYTVGEGAEVRFQPRAFLAADETVSIHATCLGLAGCCATGTCCAVRARGHGKIFFNAFGSLAKYVLQPGESRKFDNGYVLGWTQDPGLKYTLTKAADTVVGSCITGEGFAILFTNESSTEQFVFVQTRSLKALARRLQPYLANNSSNSSSNNSSGN